MTGQRQHVHLLVDIEFWKELKGGAAARGIPMVQLIEIAVRKELNLPKPEQSRDDKKKPKKIPRVNKINGTKVTRVLGVKAGVHPYTRVQDIYNKVVLENADPLGIGSKGMKKCLALNEKRKRGVRRLLKQVETLEGVEEFFLKCSKKPFHRGENDFGFRADIEYVTREENIVKILEDDGDIIPVIDLSTTYAERERMARVKEDGRAKVRRHLKTCVSKKRSPRDGLRDFFSDMESWLKTEDAAKLLPSLKNYAKDYWQHLKQGATR
jgi:hypothetical protein